MTFSFLLWDSFSWKAAHLSICYILTWFVLLPSVWAWGEVHTSRKAVKVHLAIASHTTKTSFTSGVFTWCFTIGGSIAIQLWIPGPFIELFCLLICKRSDLSASDSLNLYYFPTIPYVRPAQVISTWVCLVCLLAIRFCKVPMNSLFNKVVIMINPVDYRITYITTIEFPSEHILVYEKCVVRNSLLKYFVLSPDLAELEIVCEINIIH